ncbi:MAG: trigger factor family protein [Prevotellaceae bacterium]|jgi:trigger factor|nr:trigger factor family protein [Prevotellaceae bacterium]
MEIIENKENLVSVLTVKISKEDYFLPVERALKKIRQTTQLKGFRQGAVPMSIVKKLHEPTVRVEEINKILSEKLNEYLKDRSLVGGIIPLDKDTKINLNQDDFEFVYEAGFFPELEYSLNEETVLPFYNIISKPEDIDGSLLYYRKIYGTDYNPDTIGERDSVTVFISDSNENAGADESEVKAENIQKLEKSVQIFVPNIPDEYKPLFIGATVGTVIDVELRKVFPNEVDLRAMLNISKEQLETVSVMVKLRIDGIHGVKPAELNQDFFNRIVPEKDTVHSEEEFRNFISKKLNEEYNEKSSEQLFVDFKKMAMEKIEIPFPEEFLKKAVAFNMQNEDKDKKFTEKDFEFLITSKKWSHIVNSLLQQNDITVSEEEIVKEAEFETLNMMSIHGASFGKELFNKYVSYIIEKDGHIILDKIKNAKLTALLKEKIKLDVKDVYYDEFQKISRNQKSQDGKAENGETAETVENVEQTEKIN